MKLTINGNEVELTNTGKISKGGKEIFEVKGEVLSDGTQIYLTAYRPTVHSNKLNNESKAVTPTSKKNKKTDVTAELDIAGMVAQAVAKAMASMSPPVVDADKK